MCLASPDIKVLLHTGSVSSPPAPPTEAQAARGWREEKEERTRLNASSCAHSRSDPMFCDERTKIIHKHCIGQGGILLK